MKNIIKKIKIIEVILFILIILLLFSFIKNYNVKKVMIKEKNIIKKNNKFLFN